MRENYSGSCALEIKVAKGNTVPKSAVLPHQYAALMAVTRGGIVHKLSDEARRQQPFDAFKLSFSKAYVICAFGRECVAINIKDWQGASLSTEGDFRFVV